jgi:phosphoribosylformimino-5-aminoimidazole carboxamide ribotide isomerase
VNLYPAIDLIDGRVARLERGRRESSTVYDVDALEAVRRFTAAGARWLHVVDLNRAFGDPTSNLPHIRRVIEEAARQGMRVQVGGGLREAADLEDVFVCGAARVVLGTVAAVEPALMAALQERYGGRIAVAIDARDGEVFVRGWTEGTGRRVDELAAQLATLGIRRIVYTDVGRDGTFAGPDLDGAVRLSRATGLPVIASGGVGGLAHVTAAANAGVDGLVVGRALYEGRVGLEEAIAAAGPQEGT